MLVECQRSLNLSPSRSVSLLAVRSHITRSVTHLCSNAFTCNSFYLLSLTTEAEYRDECVCLSVCVFVIPPCWHHGLLRLTQGSHSPGKPGKLLEFYVIRGIFGMINWCMLVWHCNGCIAYKLQSNEWWTSVINVAYFIYFGCKLWLKAPGKF